MQEPDSAGEAALAPMSARTLNELHWSARRMEREKRIAAWSAAWSAAVDSMRTSDPSPEPDAPVGWDEPWMSVAEAADLNAGRDPCDWGLWADMYRAEVTA